MDLTSREIIKNLLKRYDARPFKGWGQNFLVDKRVLKKIIDSANPKKSDIVLEIGPGIGTLTQELAKRVKPAPYRTCSGTGKVIAIEKDQKMIEILKETLGGFENVEIIQGDILKLDPKPYILNTESYKIVANLPFYIVSPTIRKFLESGNPPKKMILMVQKEVAQRICSRPPNMSILAVSVQFYSRSEILFYVPRSSFWPQPKVDGAVIRVSQICKNLPKIDRNLFFKIVKIGFSQPRKQIVNNLAKMLALSPPNEVKLDKERIKEWLLKNNIKPIQRAETLSIKDWIKLTKNYIISQ